MADIDRDPEQTEQGEQAEQVPFFARFLEDQKRIRTGVKAGATTKYPSDSDEEIATTMKYPSDGDDALPLK
ncbi:microviridin/marinostatin family tricyclic proteinase inhibitor [Sorangium sp. So ce1151]|uniref:microviridin/marinostatin family tricyclic proteinase inhibitor n=1 Tax=Sorangium sp. So ce1151 TaxID=3133332 RepID=UPI003F617C4B